MPIDRVAGPLSIPEPICGASPALTSTRVSTSRIKVDRIDKNHSDDDTVGNVYNAELVRNAVDGAHMADVSATAATVSAADHLLPALGRLGSRTVPAAASAFHVAAPFIGETFGAAGLLLSMQSPAGETTEQLAHARMVDTVTRERMASTAHFDNGVKPEHTTSPREPIDVGRSHTAHPLPPLRSVKESAFATPTETAARPAHTGHATHDLTGLARSTGTAIHQPAAADRATFAKQDRVITPEHAAHLAPNGTLVNADRAIIPAAKLSGHVLNPFHDRGGDKARVFQATLGMDASQAHDLEKQLREGINTNSAIPGDVDEHGVRFAVDVPIVGPKGTAMVRSSWIYKQGSEEPSLTSVRVKVR